MHILEQFRRIVACGIVLTATSNTRADEVDFARDIQPLFAKNCVACHSSSLSEGGLNLESHAALLQGGNSGAAIDAGSPAESYLVTRVVGGNEEIMPPEDNEVGASQLTPAEVQLLRDWITAGAKNSGQPARSSIAWNSLPANLQPLYGIAASHDAQYLVYGRGNSVQVQTAPRQPPHQIAASTSVLVDPENNPGASTHRDLVHSVAISPNSQRIATGGFRCIKIWRKTFANTALGCLPESAYHFAFSQTGSRIAYVSEGTSIGFATAMNGTIVYDEAESIATSHRTAIQCNVWLPNNGSNADEGAALISCDTSGGWSWTDPITKSSHELLAEGEFVAERIAALSDSRVIGLSSKGAVFLLNIDVAGQSATAAWFEGISDVSDVVACGGQQGDSVQVGFLLATGDVVLVDGELNDTQRTSLGREYDAIALSPLGTRLVAWGPGGVDLWNVETSEHVASLNVDYAERQESQRQHRYRVQSELKLQELQADLTQLEAVHESEHKAEQELSAARQQAVERLAEAETALATAQAAVSESESRIELAQQAEDEQASADSEKELSERQAKLNEAEKSSREAQESLDETTRRLAAATGRVARMQSDVDAQRNAITAAEQQLEHRRSDEQALQLEHAKPIAVTGAVFVDEEQLVLSGADSTLRVFSSVDGLPLANILVPQPVQTMIANTAAGLNAGPVVIDGKGQVQLWDTRAVWELERTIGSAEASPFSDRITAMDFSPDGNFLAVGSGLASRSGQLAVVELESGDIVRDIPDLHQDTVLSVKYSPAGQRIATAAADKLCCIVDPETGKVHRALEGHTHHVVSVAWHAGGTELATSSADGTLKVWNATTGEQTQTIKGFEADVTAVAFVGSSRNVISTTADGSVQMHDSQNANQVATFQGSTGPLFALAISQDGVYLSVGGQSGQVWSWHVQDAKLVE